MDIRFFQLSDLPEIGRIYNAHFSDIEPPEFVDFPCVYVVHEKDKIIAIGGLKPIVEAVVLTDQDVSVRLRREALLMMFNALTYSAHKMNYKRLYAFGYDEQYINHLKEQVGFTEVSKSKLLSVEL